MQYEAELTFFKNLLKHYHMQTLVFSPDTLEPSQIDFGFHQLIGKQDAYNNLLDFFNTRIEHNKIYRIRDSFRCNYFFLLLPDTSATVLSIGPFIEHDYDDTLIMEYIEQNLIPHHLFSPISKYFISLPKISDDSGLLALLHTLAETIWGKSNNYSLISYEYDTKTIFPEFSSVTQASDPSETLFQMQLLEQRYAIEREMLLAVSQGLLNKVDTITTALTSQFTEPRSTDFLRNEKNYSIVFNTLLRKAAEQGLVHPYYIDKISSEFGHKIENCLSVSACRKLQNEMLRKYCLLVKNHSLKGYSPLIQRVIMYVASDLTADLTLSSISEILKTNPSYLSSQFKKETGTTLTDYVNKKRIEHALLLLNSTSMQIQTIAQYCGIPDVNYFTKLFKKYVNKTPKEYRSIINQR